jgi:hypothetical protein
MAFVDGLLFGGFISLLFCGPWVLLCFWFGRRR